MRERASELPPPAHTPDPAKARSPPPPPPLPGAILDLTDSLLRRLQDLEDYRIPQLAQCRGPVTFHEELAAGVRAELAGCKRDIEELKLEVDDLDRARERAAGGEHVKQVQQRLDGCTKLYRQAVVTSKRQIDASAHLLAREELFASVSGRGSPGPGSPGGSAQRGAGPNQTSDDALMSATSDVTEGLRRTLQLMQQEVDRSLVTNEMLQSQTQTMELTSTQYSTLSTLLHTSKTLITSLERADVLDRLLLFFAFTFFAAVCAYIFKKRVVDRGVRVVGGLGGLVAKGGGALAGLSKRQGAGGADVPSPSGVTGEASKVVRNEVMGEVARATAAAGAAVSAVWAGVEKVRERASKPQNAEAQEQDDREAFEDVPSREEEVEHVAAPVQAPPSPSVEPEGQDDEADDEFFDFAPDEPFEMPTPVDDAAFFDEPDSPVYAAPLESFSDEALVSSSAPPLPAESTTIDIPSSAISTPSAVPEADLPQPAAQLPLDEVPEPSEGRGLFERGDADAHSAPPVPAADGDEFEPVFLREERPPQPTMEHVEDVFDGGATEEVLDEAGEAEHLEADEELGVAGEDEEMAETGEEDKVFDRSQYEPFRPNRPDLDEQLGDINRIVEGNAVPPAASSDEPVADLPPSASLSTLDIPESTTIPTPSSVPDLDTGIDLPTDYSDIDESAAPLHPVRVPLEETAPSNRDYVAIVHDAEEAEEPRDVAGVEGITVPLDAEEVHAGTVPPLDVEESGGDPLAVEDEAGVEHQTELPIDLAAEQTLWDVDEQDTPDVEEVLAASEPPQTANEPYVEEEQANEEELLEQMLEQQMGYGGGVGAIAAANATAPLEEAAKEPAAAEPAADEQEEPAAEDEYEEAEKQEEADVDSAADVSNSSPLGETEEASADEAKTLETTSEPSATVAAEEPTVAKAVELTSTPLDESPATPEPPVPTSTSEPEPEFVEEPADNGVEEETAAPAAPPSEAEPAATATPTAAPEAQLAELSERSGEDGAVEEAGHAELEADEDIDDEASSVDDSAYETPDKPFGVPDAPTAAPFPPSEPDIVEEMVTPSPSTPEPAPSTVHLVTPTPTVESVVSAPVETELPVSDSSATEEAEQAELAAPEEEEEEEPAHPFNSTDVPHSVKQSQEQLEVEDASIGDETLADDEFAEEFEEGEEGEEYADEDGAFDELDGDEDMEAFEAPRDEL
ncbi:Sec20 family protein [Rhodotorula toruloides NP11]|uniref:Sec20 family protein n=1 Tax=Rhodotorula toruloides (strain NP11) TaxID=1130832 RepID=M7WXT9_RHOT1|nr:Sec20 family protein [Rhodotorula toruloides NP11]EMS22670.1 Sec20 family protein [Rhodotorula toruloides NP11]